jgi:hypothetical protein
MGLLFIFQVIYEHGENSGIISTGKTPDSSTRASSHLVAKLVELAKEIMNLALGNIFLYTSKRFLTCKILRHGDESFTLPPKDGVLQIFITLVRI